ncbi:MAG: AAA family ATPase [Candidatus Poribacteria bacterium]|nr:AAA family ATPase [Candidatus Poribacteria bacterium]
MSKVKDTQQHPKVEIAVKNFGPIAEANIDLRPLTVFVGPSNTGKTYFATLVYALHRIFNGFLRLPLSRRMSFIRSMDPMYSWHTRSLGAVGISYDEIYDVFKKLSAKDQSFKFADLPERTRHEIESSLKDPEIFGAELSAELKRCLDVGSISELIRFSDDEWSEFVVSLKIRDASQELWDFNMQGSELDFTVEGYIENITLLRDDGSALNEKLGFQFTLENLPRFGQNTWKQYYARALRILSGLRGTNLFNPRGHYLPAARSGIMQTHRVIASSFLSRATREDSGQVEFPTLSGLIVDFVEQLLLYEEGRESAEVMNNLAEVLEDDVLIGKIITKSSSGRFPEFLYRAANTKEDVSLTRSSSMVSELAPLVLYLRGFVQPDDILIIEEPEAHLHPGAQADIAVILARLVRAGVRVIVTTHSDWLLQEIGNLVLEGLLEDETDESASWLLPEEVGVWHFQKAQPVKEIPFKPREGISPEDYEDVAEGLYNRSVNLQQKFEKKEGGSASESE